MALDPYKYRHPGMHGVDLKEWDRQNSTDPASRRVGVTSDHMGDPGNLGNRPSGLTPALNWNAAFPNPRRPAQPENSAAPGTFLSAFPQPPATSVQPRVNPNAIAAGMGLRVGADASPASVGDSIKMHQSQQKAQALDPFSGMPKTSPTASAPQAIATPYGTVQPQHGSLETDNKAQQGYIARLPQIGQAGTPANKAFVEHYGNIGDPEAAFQRALEAHRRADAESAIM